MGIMDTVRSATGYSGDGKLPPFLSSDEKAAMKETSQPFNIVRMDRRGPNPNAKIQKDQWNVTVEFLDTGGNVIEIEDEEGNASPILRTISFGASEARDKEFPVLKQMVADNGGRLGPLCLDTAPVKNQPNPAYIFRDWANGPVQSAPAAAPPPPSGDILSPDGNYKLVNGGWVPVAAPPPPPDVVPATLPFSVAEAAKAQAASALPAPGTSQPLPEVADVVTGGDGEGGTATVTRYKGDQVRQVIYREDGVIQTPQGGLVKITDPVEKKAEPVQPTLDPTGKFMLVNGAWIPLPDSGGIAQEAAQEPQGPVVPPPPAEPVEVPVEDIPANEGPKPPKAKSSKVTVPVTTRCDTCSKQVKSSAFKNGKGVWIITHSCEATDPSTGKRIGSKAINVNDEVTAILEGAE